MKKIGFAIVMFGFMTAMIMTACNRDHSCENNPEFCAKSDGSDNGGTYRHLPDDYVPPSNSPRKPPSCRVPGNCPDMTTASADPTDMGAETGDSTDLSPAVDMSQPSPDLSSGGCGSSYCLPDGGAWHCDGKIVKLDSEQVGVVGASVSSNNLTITVVSWLEKTDQPGSYYGFTFTTSGSGTLASYLVKGGQDLFEDYRTNWTNPYGSSGPLVHGVSHIDFCIW